MAEEYDRQKVRLKQYQITFMSKFNNKNTKTMQNIFKLTINTQV